MIGYYYVTAWWVPYHVHTMIRDVIIPLCGVRVLHAAQTIELNNHHGDCQKENMN